MAKTKNKKSSVIGRIIITFIGVVMILTAFAGASLALFGQTAPAEVSVSRIGGRESNQPVEKEYKWSVGWTFTVDGREYVGGATARGSAINVKHGNTVWYFSFAPAINSLFAKDYLSAWTLLLIGAGVLLIIVPNKKNKRKPSRFAGKTEQQVLNEMTGYDDSVAEFFDEQAEAERAAADRFCPECGSRVKAEARFCPACGARLE